MVLLFAEDIIEQDKKDIMRNMTKKSSFNIIQIILLLIILMIQYMGAVFRPKDLARGHRKIIDDAIKDFTPDTKDNVIKVLDSWKGKESEEKLKDILGDDKAEELLKNIKSKTKK